MGEASSWQVVDLGTRSFREVWTYQRDLVEKRQTGGVPDTLIVVDDSEHADHHENCTTDFNIGLSEGAASDLIGLAPVPATDRLTVTMRATGGAVVLIDPQGRALMTQRLAVGANDVDVQHFARGMFIIEVRDARGGIVHRSPILLR